MLVLRDPTTAVDAVTENAIADGLRRSGDGERIGRSTVMITTSPPLLGRCDRVLFLRRRRRPRRGTHAELLELPDYAAAVLR